MLGINVGKSIQKYMTLEKRRLRGDLIETFKIITGREKVDKHEFFEISNNMIPGTGCLKLWSTPLLSTHSRTDWISAMSGATERCQPT